MKKKSKGERLGWLFLPEVVKPQIGEGRLISSKELQERKRTNTPFLID